jgi:hypothetical protein
LFDTDDAGAAKTGATEDTGLDDDDAAVISAL